MNRLLWLLMPLLLLGGCDREPVYRGLNFVVFNYAPWSVDTLSVRDHYGNRGGGGVVASGGGEGSASCCGSLKGTDFDVYWTAVDDDKAAPHAYDDSYKEFVMKKMTKVHFPPTKIPPGPAPLYFEIHIYPDEHIEFELTRELLNRTRLPIVVVGDWILKTYEPQLNPTGNEFKDARLFRKIARIIGDAWKKYRLQDKQDLRQYVYFSMLVNPNFDELPQIQDALLAPGRKAGDLAKYLRDLPASTVTALMKARADTNIAHE